MPWWVWLIIIWLGSNALIFLAGYGFHRSKHGGKDGSH